MDKVDQATLFKYPPLKNPRQIRLIEVHASQGFDDPIEISFVTTELDRPDYYQTLSYTWGETFSDDSHLTDTVFCAGSQLRITSNLNSFLKRFRHEAISGDSSTQMPIWVDALSINQKDNFERERQVAMMAQIYKLSFQLIIWLGEVSLPDCDGWPFSQSWDAFVRDEMFAPDSPEKAAFEQMVQCSWFQRRWIIQELLYSRSSTIWIGSKKIPWSNFCVVCERLRLVMPLAIDRAASYAGKSPNQPLWQNLIMWDYSKCGDPRDCVYALLSISNNVTSFSVDYSSDPETVYYRTAKHMTASGDMLVIEALLTSAVLRRATSDHSLPSWVPDWQNAMQNVTEDEYAIVKQYILADSARKHHQTSPGYASVHHRYLSFYAFHGTHSMAETSSRARLSKPKASRNGFSPKCALPRDTEFWFFCHEWKRTKCFHPVGQDLGVTDWCFFPESRIVFGLTRLTDGHTAQSEHAYRLVCFVLLKEKINLLAAMISQRTRFVIA